MRVKDISYADVAKKQKNVQSQPQNSGSISQVPNYCDETNKSDQNHTTNTQKSKTIPKAQPNQTKLSTKNRANQAAHNDIVNILTELLSEIISLPRNEAVNLLLTRLPSIIIAITSQRNDC